MLESKRLNKKILYLLFNPPPSARVRATIFENIYREKDYNVTYYNMYSLFIQKLLTNKYLKNISVIHSLVLYIEKVLIKLLENSVCRIARHYDGIILIKYVDPNFILKLKQVTKAKILYDFDDSMWLDSFIGIEKFKKILFASDYISCDNYILANEALKYNKNTFIQKGPTNVELYNLKLKKEKDKAKNGVIKIGWLGSASTLFYLYSLYNVFDKISDKYPNVVFKIIGSTSNFNSIFNFEKSNFEHIEKYDESLMIEELHDLDIGIFPLFENEMSYGRGSLKATLYMSFGVPCVAYNLGMNKDIITSNVDGFLVKGDQEWFDAISKLVESEELRKSFSIAGFSKMKDNYSIESCFKDLETNFLSLL